MSKEVTLQQFRDKINDIDDPKLIAKVDNLLSMMADINNMKEKIELLEENCASMDIPVFHFLATALDPDAISLAANTARGRKKVVYKECGIEESVESQEEESSEKGGLGGLSGLGGLGSSFG